MNQITYIVSMIEVFFEFCDYLFIPGFISVGKKLVMYSKKHQSVTTIPNSCTVEYLFHTYVIFGEADSLDIGI